jgi:hypothetical protein
LRARKESVVCRGQEVDAGAATRGPQWCPPIKRLVLEDRMIRAATAAALLAAAALPAYPQAVDLDTEKGRFTFHQVDDGMLRLDTRTGHVSLCARRELGWACQAVPDDRTVLEAEIARLQRENATLKQEMIARGVPLPGGVRPDAPQPPQVELKLPSDADLDRVMAFFEKIWRRLIEIVRNIQRDMEKKG